MRPGWFVSVQSLVFALLLHAAALVLLLVSFSFTPELTPVKPVSIVNAVTVDKAKVDEEVRRLKQEDEKKQRRAEDLEKKLAAEEKKADEIKNQRIEEEKQYLETKQKKEEEQKKHEEMQQRKLEEEKKAKSETEKKQLEEEKKTKTEAEKKKKEAELKKKEEEKKREEAAKALLQEQLEAEQSEEQKQQNATLLQKIVNEITNKVIRNFNKSGLPDNLSCKLMVKLLPNGEVASVSVIKTSGNEIFDRRALLAVEKSSPFMLPEEVDLEKFEQLDLRELSFTFIPPKD